MHVKPYIFLVVVVACIEKDQNRSISSCKEEGNTDALLANSGLQILQESEVTASGLNRLKKEVRHVKSASYSALVHPAAASGEVKIEATDQGMSTFPFV